MNIQLESFHLQTGTRVVPTATIALVFDGERREDAGCGETVIDAIFNAFCRVTGLKLRLLSAEFDGNLSGFSAKVKFEGSDKLSASVEDQDIWVAFLKALINAVTKSADRRESK